MNRLRTHRLVQQLRGFSLIELLVTVAVIGILAGLLLPTLSKSKDSAQRIQCLSNLRQLGMATQMYWDDNHNQAFRYRGIFTNGGDIFWFGWLARGTEGLRAFDATQGALYPYLKGRGVEICPSLNYANPKFKLKANGAAYGYGYNLHLSTSGSAPPLNVGKISNPSDLVLMADSAQINTFQSPASPSNPLLEEFYYISANASEATTHFRHRKTANTVFCDGHVAGEKAVPGTIDTRVSGQILGRLRTEILIP